MYACREIRLKEMPVSYSSAVYEMVVKKNPAEPEFHQAVKEVLKHLNRCWSGTRNMRKTAFLNAGEPGIFRVP